MGRVTSFPAAKLHEFIMLENNGNISHLSKEVKSRVMGLLERDGVFFYTADQLLLDCDSHLRFFEDWLNEQNAVVGADR